MKLTEIKSIIQEEVRKVRMVESFKSIVLEELYKLLAEGKLDDLKKQYVDTNKVDLKDFNKLASTDTTPTKKYLGWILKQWTIADKDSKDINSFANYIKSYDNAVKGNKTKQKDINAFKSFSDLKNEIDILDISGQLQSKSASAADAITILDNEDLLIKMPKSHEASRKLGLSDFAFRSCEGGGKDSAWCTTYKTSDHWNDYYYQNNVTFYYTKVKSQEMLQKLASIPKLQKTWKNYVVIAFAVIPIENKKTKESFVIDAYDGQDKQVPRAILNLVIDILGIKNYLVPQVSKEEREKAKMQLAYKQINRVMRKEELTEEDVIDLKNLPQQVVFPAQFRKANEINIRNSSVVFPEILEVKDLKINGSKEVKLPTKLQVENLMLNKCEKITEISNVKASGEVEFWFMDNLQKVTSVKAKELQVFECEKVVLLDNIETEDLRIEKCNNLRQITNSKIKTIDFEGIAPPNFDFNSLPAGAGIIGVDFSEMKTLPPNIKIGTDTVDEGLASTAVSLPIQMKEIPQGVTFGKSAYITLEEGSQLQSLPDNIQLDVLKISEKTALQKLPANLTIGSRLILKNDIGTLPASIMFKRHARLVIEESSKLKTIELNNSEVNLYVTTDLPSKIPFVQDFFNRDPKHLKLAKTSSNYRSKNQKEAAEELESAFKAYVREFLPNVDIVNLDLP